MSGIGDACLTYSDAGNLLGAAGFLVLEEIPGGREPVLILKCDDVYLPGNPSTESAIGKYGYIRLEPVSVLEAEEARLIKCLAEMTKSPDDDRNLPMQVKLSSCHEVISITTIDRIPVNHDDPDATRVIIETNPISQ
ncbi:MAG: hypothetical protein R3217_10230 [Gammaproteobacteria bacterium]|nr:hypothetical protein [Gammaproteobacteria bacterium]